MNTPTEALANHLDVDIQDLKDYRYQPSRTTKPVFTYGDDYLCATKGRAKPAQSTERMADYWFWDEVKSHVNESGYKIFRRLTEEEITDRGLDL